MERWTREQRHGARCNYRFFLCDWDECSPSCYPLDKWGKRTVSGKRHHHILYIYCRSSMIHPMENLPHESDTPLQESSSLFSECYPNWSLLYLWRSRKKSDICVTLHPSSLRRRVTTPHSSGFAGFDLRHFTKSCKFWLFTSSSFLNDQNIYCFLLEQCHSFSHNCLLTVKTALTLSLHKKHDKEVKKAIIAKIMVWFETISGNHQMWIPRYSMQFVMFFVPPSAGFHRLNPCDLPGRSLAKAAQGSAVNKISWACEITPWRDFTRDASDMQHPRLLQRQGLFCLSHHKRYLLCHRNENKRYGPFTVSLQSSTFNLLDLRESMPKHAKREERRTATETGA